MTVQFLEQLWPLGCMSVSAAPEQMCQPKSMNFVRKMYVGTRIPSVEPHGLARGFSQVLRKKIACAGQMLMDHGMPFPEAKNTLFDLLTKDEAKILAVSNSIFPGSKKYVVGCCR